MDRRGFLRRVGFTGAAVVVAPAMVMEVASTPVQYCGPGLRAQMEASNIVYYEDLTIEAIEKVFEKAFKEELFTGQSTYRIYTGPKGQVQLRNAVRDEWLKQEN